MIDNNINKLNSRNKDSAISDAQINTKIKPFPEQSARKVRGIGILDRIFFVSVVYAHPKPPHYIFPNK